MSSHPTRLIKTLRKGDLFLLKVPPQPETTEIMLEITKSTETGGKARLAVVAPKEVSIECLSGRGGE